MKLKLTMLGLFALTTSLAVGQVTQSTGQHASNATTCGDLDALFTQAGHSMNNLLYAGVNVSDKPGTVSLNSIKGSPYLADTFKKSKVYYGDKLLGSLYTRYNIFSKEIEIKRTQLEEEAFEALLKDEKIRVVNQDGEYQYTSFIDNKGQKHEDYLIAVTHGDVYKLYQHHRVKYIEGKKAENSMVNDIPNRFTSSKDHYLMDVQTSLVSQIPTKKSKLIELFKNANKTELANQIKKKSLNIKKEQDLVRIFELANTTSPAVAAQE